MEAMFVEAKIKMLYAVQKVFKSRFVHSPAFLLNRHGDINAKRTVCRKTFLVYN